MPRGGGTHTNVITKTFLIDSQNHTGYSQILEESDGTTRTTYTIGDDVITQCSGTTPRHLIYDGLGSTRQLTDNTGALVADQVFNYDSYGVMVGYSGTPQTNLRYTGEYYDTALKQYNLRARYYNPLIGRFSQTDPFAGSPQDPQSLHKYLYCHANPVNGVDPSGKFSMAINIVIAVAVFAIVFTISYSIKKAIVNSIMTSSSTVISPGTSKFRYIEVSLSLLEDAVNIPNSGVNQSDVTGLRNMLVSGKIYDYAKSPFGNGLSERGNIYVGLPAVIEPVLGNLPSNQNSFTNSNYPDELGYFFSYQIASTLFHEWQHHHYGAGAFREKAVNSSNWQKTYGREIQLAKAVINHLESDTSVVYKDRKIQELKDIIDNATHLID